MHVWALFFLADTIMPVKTISLSSQVLDNGPDAPELAFVKRKKPAWLRAKLPGGPGYQRLRSLVDEHALHTVCESAKCPNLGECWGRGTATIMILGDVCTRSCGFCHIKTGRPPVLDTDEPRRVGEAVALMRLRHIVITSVNRDELPDGGAGIWADTIRAIRDKSPQTSIEVLIPDFCGDWDALQKVIDARPDILNHNMETVRRLYKVVRPQAKYDRSIELLRRCKDAGLRTKTGIMVGIGETDAEVTQLMEDVVDGSSCDILTIGQYLQPTRNHLPITRWVTPEQFAEYKRIGEEIGFGHVESGPLVRSSYHAEDQVLSLDGQAD
ncbi:MAG: lipoyl synthase [Phycisphaeraceae bacterium]